MAVLVYQLIDPADGEVFYVGKGTEKRPYAHVGLAKAGNTQNNPAKHARILAILGRGEEPIVEIVAAHETDDEALDHEAELIASLPGLTNILARGWAPTPEEARRRSLRTIKRHFKSRPGQLESLRRKWAILQSYGDTLEWPAAPPGSELNKLVRDGMVAFFARADEAMAL